MDSCNTSAMMEPTPPAESTATPPPSGPYSLLRQSAIQVALGLLLIAVLVWIGASFMMSQFRGEVARRFAEVDTTARDGRALARQNQETLAALQAKVGVLEANLAQAQSQQVALDAMYQELLRSRDERLLSEIEQSLTIASQQLQLAGNIEAALMALQDADIRLTRAAQPQFLPLRKLLARDIDRLRAVPGSNLSGVMLKLEGVIAGIDSLPLAFERRPKSPGKKITDKQPAAPDSLWRQLLADFWGEVRQLVRIQRVDQTDPAVLAPDQVFFLRENLKLRLVNARMSLLARDASSFREDLRQSRTWFEKYFDTQSRQVQAAIASLASLEKQDLSQSMPTINETLVAVRNFRLPRGRN
jgi:uroporphyrin-3 C-methyltransferase